MQKNKSDNKLRKNLLGDYDFGNDTRYRCSGEAKDYWAFSAISSFKKRQAVPVGESKLKNSHTFVLSFKEHETEFGSEFGIRSEFGTIDVPETAPALNFDL